MEVIKLKPTDTTPEVVLDANDGVFSIAGVSMPNDPRKFYLPILEWLDEYKSNPVENARIHIKLDYFNTASSKMILELMKRVGEIGSGNKILWLYDPADEDIKEVGEEYLDMLGSDIIEIQKADN